MQWRSVAGNKFYYSDDQKVWNTLLRHHRFRQLNHVILPENLIMRLVAEAQPKPDTFVLHAVGQGSKVDRLKAAGHWYFEKECSIYEEVTSRSKGASVKIEDV